MNKNRSKFSTLAIGILSLLAGVFILNGCASTKTSSPESQNATNIDFAGDWIVVSVLNNGTEATTTDNIHATLSADALGNGTFAVYGFAGVNNYNATATVDGTKFSAEALATTLMAGTPEAEQFERSFLEVLVTVDTVMFAANGNGMELRDETSLNALILQRLVLNDSAWTLSAYKDANAVVTIPSGITTPELTFSANNELSGFTGVNYLTGTYNADATKRTLSFPQIGTTRMAAATESAASMEQAYLDLLGAATVYQISGDTLRMLSDDGTTLLVFNRK